MDSPTDFTKRLLLVFAGIIALVVIGRMIILPDSWGEYGYYRGDYVDEEASRAMVYGTNDSCRNCHEEVYDMKRAGVHKRLSCEICHAPVSEHVLNDKKFADMPVKKGEPQRELCLTCHQSAQGRPETFAMIQFPKHLEDQKVKTTHECNRCHTVHAPLESMKYIEVLRKRREEGQQ